MIYDYSLRGKCKEMSEAAVAADPSLTLVKGWYFCPIWNREEEHWWCKRADGSIFDPTAAQFPSGGIPEFYREFTGTFECSECDKTCHQDEMIHEGRYHFCSERCYMICVGIL